MSHGFPAETCEKTKAKAREAWAKPRWQGIAVSGIGAAALTSRGRLLLAASRRNRQIAVGSWHRTHYFRRTMSDPHILARPRNKEQPHALCRTLLQ
jgi:hypothetical protein